MFYLIGHKDDVSINGRDDTANIQCGRGERYAIQEQSLAALAIENHHQLFIIQHGGGARNEINPLLVMFMAEFVDGST